jgi:hypothetical protein
MPAGEADDRLLVRGERRVIAAGRTKNIPPALAGDLISECLAGVRTLYNCGAR